jgi:transcriptional regulator with XRE-family HTH domain
MEERLLRILKHYDHSPSSFADKLGVQRSSISHLLSGRNKPGFDFLSRMITEFTDLNIDWVLTGKGNMLKKPVLPPVNLTLFDTLSPAEGSPVDKSVTDDKKPEETSDGMVTNVNNMEIESRNRATKVIIFYKDKTWDEFLPSEA